jgi:hypothetical protein
MLEMSKMMFVQAQGSVTTVQLNLPQVNLTLKNLPETSAAGSNSSASLGITSDP